MTKLWLKYALGFFLALFLSGCSQSSSGYIQIYASSDNVLNRFNDVRNIFISDKRFIVDNFSTQSASWKREASFAYDPTPESKNYHKKYYVLVQANADTGDLVVFFYEFGTKEVSNQGKVLFEELVDKAKKKFGDNSVQYGIDDKDKIRELHALFKP